jgi:hypothetical protein
MDLYIQPIEIQLFVVVRSDEYSSLLLEIVYLNKRIDYFFSQNLNNN